jgi:RNA polymerase sigma-70 factor (ECF subfamily)
VLEIAEGKVVGLNSFLDTERLFPLFDLPASLDS